MSIPGKWWVLGLLMLLSHGGRAQVRDFDPDTVQVHYYGDDNGLLGFPVDGISCKCVVVRTRPTADGYEDQAVNSESGRPRFLVRHLTAARHAELRMYYPDGALRVVATFRENPAGPFPTAAFVPSLRVPLAAGAVLDGRVQTFYPTGQLRQTAVYQSGQRVQSQCYDFRNRPVACNDNPLIVPAGLPPQVGSGREFDLVTSGGEKRIRTKARFVTDSARLVLRLRLRPNELSPESVRLLRTGTPYAIIGLMVRKDGNEPKVMQPMGMQYLDGSTLTGELSSAALSAARIFLARVRPALIDGEPVNTYMRLPVELELK